MCEWLSSDDWSDIQLYCNGHTFNAHQAVLASVSSFLRSVLLSCQSRDSTVCIILPDFDLDAMTFVLHYIYHGEVVIPQCRLQLFLDIIQAMQIYVDPQYLTRTNGDLQISPLDLKMYDDSTKINSFVTREKFVSTNRGLNDFGSTSSNSFSKDFWNKVQSPLHSSDLRDKLWRCCFREKLSLSAGDMSLCDDEQKTDLRDLFIETYTQNGSDNGLAAGVLAISNVHYHSPTSVLFTNANGGQSNDALSEPWMKTPEFRSHLTPAYKSHRSPQTYESFNVPLKKDHSEIFSEKINQGEVYEKINDDSLLKYCHMNNISERSQCEEKIILKREYLLDLRHCNTKANGMIRKVNKGLSIDESIKKYENNENIRKNKYLEKQGFNKDSIRNKVNRSPWAPQSLFFYKPFRRKTAPESDVSKIELHLGNDKNNNINETIPPLNSAKTTDEQFNSETRDASETSHSHRLSNKNQFKCATCNRVFACNDSFMAHMQRHSTTTRYSCGECYKTFSQLRNYKYHMSVHRGTKEFATTCPICGKYFNDRGYLSSHMKIHRNRKEYKCSMCPKSFNQRVAFNMHVRIHTGVKPHVCDECGKAFSRKMLLKQHQRTHSGERPYACTHCDKRFADRSNMTLHLRLHTGVKPFACTICPKSFTKKHHLKSHLNFHTGAKPYSCPQCKVSFTQSSNMRTHYKKCNASGASPSTAESS